MVKTQVSTKFSDLLAFSGPAPERINGRLAMVGFVAALAVELSKGENVLAQISDGGVSWFLEEDGREVSRDGDRGNDEDEDEDGNNDGDGDGGVQNDGDNGDVNENSVDDGNVGGQIVSSSPWSSCSGLELWMLESSSV
ncbi:secreted acidic protein 2-like [Brassica napus]|uniref:secreted acidic protein 2-like n=1 Tax=Brassica napus TaxID=3708 RepID=UPI002078FCEC|nr:secreted acidic protein 2-like [Brassica napus]